MTATITDTIADSLNIPPRVANWTLPGVWQNNRRVEPGEFLVHYYTTPERLTVQRLTSGTTRDGLLMVGRLSEAMTPKRARRLLERRGLVIPHPHE